MGVGVRVGRGTPVENGQGTAARHLTVRMGADTMTALLGMIVVVMVVVVEGGILSVGATTMGMGVVDAGMTAKVAAGGTTTMTESESTGTSMVVEGVGTAIAGVRRGGGSSGAHSNKRGGIAPSFLSFQLTTGVVSRPHKNTYTRTRRISRSRVSNGRVVH